MDDRVKVSDKSSDRKPSGRPNQGKTETIRQRKVDVYLPTTELLSQWKEAAESSSKHILEVEEQYLQDVTKVSMPFLAFRHLFEYESEFC